MRVRSALVVGAGFAGLSTAWFLQEHGVEVTVVDRRRVAAGASWGNAGWLSPALAVPLPSPAMFRAGLRSLPHADAPLNIPPRPDPRLAGFLLRLARNSTHRRWQVSMAAFAALNRIALDAYDLLAEGGVAEPTNRTARFLIAFTSDAERAEVVEELAAVRAAGQDVDYEPLTGEQVRAAEPAVTDAVTAGMYLPGQRSLHPSRYIAALADAVRERGGKIVEGAAVDRVRDTGQDVHLDGAGLRADVAVLATGAWLSPLARPFGVRVPVQAGRGYSVIVSGGTLPAGPTDFPGPRVVCTPLGDGTARVSGMMEFTDPDRPLDPRRLRAVLAAARRVLRDIDWAGRTDEWVGPRPCTSDGLPLVGPTGSPRVFVCGGHNMWGVALGPVTGRLLAEAIVTGRLPAELTPLHPLRRP